MFKSEAGTLFTSLVRMKSRVSFGGKEGRTTIQILTKLGMELGTLWLEGRDLSNCFYNLRYFYTEPTCNCWSRSLSKVSLSANLMIG